MLIRVEEDRGKAVNQTRWFKSNMKFFKVSKNESGDKTFQLSRMGMKLYASISKTKFTTNMKLVAESFEEFKENQAMLAAFNEGKQKAMTADVYDKLDDDKKMKLLLSVCKDPDKAEYNLSKKFDDLSDGLSDNMYENKIEDNE